ncbi:hypothetical protein EVAR_18375_1 [Eumeta japonica]|uniref:Uncharacterized protein n=1 Tax=Eumeta variegata TaxID=151549 RepID=A0A4C1UTY2_EUMVA|nr:hypothetical protein EVAR_18375_1 [Eumeta japonica]
MCLRTSRRHVVANSDLTPRTSRIAALCVRSLLDLSPSRSVQFRDNPIPFRRFLLAYRSAGSAVKNTYPSDAAKGKRVRAPAGLFVARVERDAASDMDNYSLQPRIIK